MDLHPKKLAQKFPPFFKVVENMNHTERESLAASIKGLTLEEHQFAKKKSSTRDPADAFAAWQERFIHELTSEFGPLPSSFFESEASDEDMKTYIKQIRKKFRLCLK